MGAAEDGDTTAFAEEQAGQAIRESLPTSPDNAMTTSELVDKLKEQDVKRTVAKSTLAGLIQAGAVTRVGGGKKGDPAGTFFLPNPPFLPTERTHRICGVERDTDPG